MIQTRKGPCKCGSFEQGGLRALFSFFMFSVILLIISVCFLFMFSVAALIVLIVLLPGDVGSRLL